MATVRPVNLTDFTGGLNMRGDAFELGENESPDMLNVDVDLRGGFVARRGWTRWNTTAVGGTWDPRTLYVHELSDGTDRVWLASNGLLYYATTGTWSTKLQASATDVVVSGSPHDADFAAWGDDLYIACGSSNQSVKVVGTTATRMTAGAAATWTEYTAPSTATMPKAEFIAAHAGYIFVAATNEDSVSYPNRVRWSHPNNPVAWQVDDYIDLKEGGGPITGLIPMRDHLLVFKQSAVWAIYGYDSDSWQVVNVSRERGAVTRQAIARSEGAVFFYSHLEGIYAISDGKTPQEVSAALRPMFTDGGFSTTLQDSVWLGWVGQRLYFAAPYSLEVAATDAASVFVFDPSVGNGVWLLYRGSDGGAVGPYAQGGFGGGAGLKLAAARESAFVMKLEDSELPLDDFNGTPTGFDSHYTTRWVDAGAPTLKKSWRRPDLVLKERSSGYTLTVEAYRDYDEASVTRTKVVTVASGGSGAVWGSFVWGDGTIYGPEAKGSVIERSGNLGPARAVQLKFTGQVGKAWGVDAIILKFVPRRMR